MVQLSNSRRLIQCAPWLLAMSALVVACLPSPSALFELEDPQRPPTGDCVIFGRVDLPPGVFSKVHCARLARDLGEFERFLGCECGDAENGWFYWHLPPGEYVIQGVEAARCANTSRANFIPLRARFHVPQEPARAVYVGTLRVTEKQADILDEYAPALEVLRVQAPELAPSAVKQLMEFE